MEVEGRETEGRMRVWPINHAGRWRDLPGEGSIGIDERGALGCAAAWLHMHADCSVPCSQSGARVRVGEREGEGEVEGGGGDVYSGGHR